MRNAYFLIALVFSTAVGCGPSNHTPSDNGSDGAKNGLIEYPPDKDGYVTSAFQGVDTYSATAMSYICTVMAVKTGYEPSALSLLSKSDQANGIKINPYASGLLLKDAENWWNINNNKIDTENFFNDYCKTAIDNIRNLYGKSVVSENSGNNTEYSTPHLPDLSSLRPESASYLKSEDFTRARRIAQAGYPNARVSHLVGPEIPRGATYSGFIIALEPKPEDALIVKGAFTSAFPMYLQAYEADGDPDAAHNLGLMYARGLGVAQDREKALEYLTYSQANRRWDADSWEISKLSK